MRCSSSTAFSAVGKTLPKQYTLPFWQAAAKLLTEFICFAFVAMCRIIKPVHPAAAALAHRSP